MRELEAGEPLEGTLVPADVPVEMRYEDEDPGKVDWVFVRVEYADGRIREYGARDPQDFTISDPEQVPTMSFRRTGLSAGGMGVVAAVPSLSLSFTANPRQGLHIRTEKTATSGAS
jgi:hypothetical protein